ncbi:MAG: histidine kinase, partial [Gemmatimonadota bacterium]
PTALAVAWVWALLTPLVFRLTRRVAPARVGWVPSVLAHAVSAIACAALVTWWRRLVLSIAANWAPEPYLPALLYWIDVWLFVYASLVVMGHALAVRRRYVDRTVRAHLLEAQLARAQLQFLELQLQPHFLFNALNAISELAHEAPHAAERMLRRLQALLSISLERSGRDEVTLDEELAALEPYLDIQRTRFSDWLSVGVAVPAALRRALVPHLILQPLVENAIRHGLSVRQGAGKVIVRAERKGDRLVMRVEDDGVGLRHGERARDNARREGIGLRNASERLRQLYGSDHRFELRDAPSGGVTVELEIPYREGEGASEAGRQPLDAATVLGAPSLDDPATWRTGEYATMLPALAERPMEPPDESASGSSPSPDWQPSGSFRTVERATTGVAPAAGVPPSTTPAASPSSAAPAPAALSSAPALSPRAWGGIAALWLVLAVFWTNQMVLYTASARPNDDYSWLELARLQVATSVIWLALSPVVFALARRFRMDASNWLHRLPLHACFGLAAGLVHTGVMQLSGLSRLPVLSPGNMNPITGDFFVYLGLLAWSHARDFASWYRMREVEGARLSARIAGSRFQALRAQLRPQFLLSTLELLADLVHRDVPRAERLIIRLADTLRLTLESGRDATVSLRQELDLLHACVETHRLGIRGGVRLVTEVSPSALDLPIPSRLLCTM